MMATRRFERPDRTPPGPYRRLATRFEPTRRDASLAWRDPSVAGGAHQHFALLLDISESGVALATDQVPHTDANVWLRLDGDPSTSWTEARVVDVTTTTIGPHLVRLAFRGPFSFEILQATVCG
jgi:PilZ domain